MRRLDVKYSNSSLVNAFVEYYRQVILGTAENHWCEPKAFLNLRDRYSAIKSVRFNLDVVQCQSQNDELTNDEIGIVSSSTLDNRKLDLSVHAWNKKSYSMLAHSENI